MATYKVMQDIEADDKLVGPLSFRQFVYAGICVFFLYLSFVVITKGAWFISILFLPVALLSGFFAWPWSNEQPTEVWALAKIRFFLKPRRRIWNQSGVKELVTVTAPKKIERVYTNGLTQMEVQNRLKALADTVDSRGWAVKNVTVSMYNQMSEPSDRLVSASVLPQAVPIVDIQPSEDMLDEDNSRVAKQFDSMIKASSKAHRQEVIKKMQQNGDNKNNKPATIPKAQPAPSNNYWFLNQPNQPATNIPQNVVTFNTQVVTPGTSAAALPVTAAMPTKDEEELIKQHAAIEEQAQPAAHLRAIQPLSAQAAATNDIQQTSQPSVPDPAIVELATNNDLNVATIAREAKKRQELPQDEVVISLH